MRGWVMRPLSRSAGNPGRTLKCRCLSARVRTLRFALRNGSCPGHDHAKSESPAGAVADDRGSSRAIAKAGLVRRYRFAPGAMALGGDAVAIAFP